MSPLRAFLAFLASIAIVIVAKTFAWLLQLKTRNAGLVDAVWAWTLGGLALHYAAGASDGLAAALARRIVPGRQRGGWLHHGVSGISGRRKVAQIVRNQRVRA